MRIDEDGTIPTTPEINWLNGRLNNFRQNVQPDGLFYAPDAVLADGLCAVLASDLVRISVVVRNEGVLAVPAGTLVLLTHPDEGELGQSATTVALQPGQFEVIDVEFMVPATLSPPFSVTAVVDPEQGAPAMDELNECLEDNNSFEIFCITPA